MPSVFGLWGTGLWGTPGSGAATGGGGRSGWKKNSPGCKCCGGSGVGVSVPGCPCATSPGSITMTSSAPATNNHIFQNATIVYGPTPADLLPVIFTPNSYLSTASFADPLLGVDFRYWLTCSGGAYVLTRVYPTSPFGSPFRDGIRYDWVPGFAGNACDPFGLTIGQIFPGGDASCVVTLVP